LAENDWTPLLYIILANNGVDKWTLNKQERKAVSVHAFTTYKEMRHSSTHS
jgi:hypothetical protein